MQAAKKKKNVDQIFSIYTDCVKVYVKEYLKHSIWLHCASVCVCVRACLCVCVYINRCVKTYAKETFCQEL